MVQSKYPDPRIPSSLSLILYDRHRDLNANGVVTRMAAPVPRLGEMMAVVLVEMGNPFKGIKKTVGHVYFAMRNHSDIRFRLPVLPGGFTA